MGRELVSEGLARMRAPLLIVSLPPGHPGRLLGHAKGLETPIRATRTGRDSRPSSLREER